MSAPANVAIFGANGYLGRHLAHYMATVKGWPVTGFGLQETFRGNDEIAYFRVDVSDRAQMARCADFDQIYFFSGLSGTAASFRNYMEFVRVNEIGLLNVLDHYKDRSYKPKIIFPSTRLVYKGVEGQPLAEDAEKEFKTIYASSKYAGELYLRMYRTMYGFDYTVFRICVPYGQLVDGSRSYGTVGAFLEKATAGKPIVLFGDGRLKRTFTHVMDVCRQMVGTSALPESSGKCFNIDGETLSLAGAAELIARKFGVEVQFTAWPPADLKLESGDTIFDASRIRALLPRTLTHSFVQWINE